MGLKVLNLIQNQEDQQFWLIEEICGKESLKKV